VGILLAVPVAAVLGVMVRFGLAQYLDSMLYGSTPPADSDDTGKRDDA
jgi:predicted PurR-regulated permease PerM